jgi:hypothetical protein
METNFSRVRVYVWFNSEFFHNKGHVALGFASNAYPRENIYVSFWPNIARHSPRYDGSDFLVKKYDGGCFRTYNYDKLKVNSGAPPDQIIELRGLDVDKIYAEFENILKIKPRFDILGSVFPFSLFSNIANCTQLVYRLLLAGGVAPEAQRFIQYAWGSVLCTYGAYAFFYKWSNLTVDSLLNNNILQPKKSSYDSMPRQYLLKLSENKFLAIWFAKAIVFTNRSEEELFVKHFLYWLGGLYICSDTKYYGAIFSPLISGVIGGLAITINALAGAQSKQHLIGELKKVFTMPNSEAWAMAPLNSLAIFLTPLSTNLLAVFSIPLMGLICFLPINFPSVFYVNTPQKIYKSLLRYDHDIIVSRSKSNNMRESISGLLLKRKVTLFCISAMFIPLVLESTYYLCTRFKFNFREGFFNLFTSSDQVHKSDKLLR